MTRIVGADPGCSGALALVELGSEAGPRLLDVLDMPMIGATGKRLVDGAVLLDWLEGANADRLVLEMASPRSGDGKGASFQFAVAYGGLGAAMLATGKPIDIVTPASWKARAKLAGIKPKTAAKKAALAAARLMFGAPAVLRLEKHEDRAEAALIAVYGRRHT